LQMTESAGSRRGQKYSAAGGKALENLGEKRVGMVTNGGVQTEGTWQMVEVMRPLNSVRQICKQGNRVIFGYNGGVIQNVVTGHEIPFEVEDNIYTLDLWMPPEKEVEARLKGSEEDGGALGFPRPGWKR